MKITQLLRFSEKNPKVPYPSTVTCLVPNDYHSLCTLAKLFDLFSANMNYEKYAHSFFAN